GGGGGRCGGRSTAAATGRDGVTGIRRRAAQSTPAGMPLSNGDPTPARRLDSTFSLDHDPASRAAAAANVDGRGSPQTTRITVPKFLIEVPHEASTEACLRVVQVFLATGSHFLTNAEWGCMDGEHACWMVVEADDKGRAMALLPQASRHKAKIVSLNRFSMASIEPILQKHPTARLGATSQG